MVDLTDLDEVKKKKKSALGGIWDRISANTQKSAADLKSSQFKIKPIAESLAGDDEDDSCYDEEGNPIKCRKSL